LGLAASHLKSRACQEKKASRQCNIGEVIPGLRIESNLLIEIDFLVKRSGYPPSGLLYHVAALVNKSRNACVGRAGHPPTVFDSAQLRIGQMLVFPRSIAPPSVIRHHGDELGALADIFRDVISPDGFIADGRSGTDAALSVEHGRLVLAAVTTRGPAKRLEKRFHER